MAGGMTTISGGEWIKPRVYDLYDTLQSNKEAGDCQFLCHSLSVMLILLYPKTPTS